MHGYSLKNITNVELVAVCDIKEERAPKHEIIIQKFEFIPL